MFRASCVSLPSRNAPSSPGAGLENSALGLGGPGVLGWSLCSLLGLRLRWQLGESVKMSGKGAWRLLTLGCYFCISTETALSSYGAAV